MEREEVFETPPLAEELLGISGHWGRKRELSSMIYPWLNMPLWTVTNTHDHVGTLTGLSGREQHREVVEGEGQ